MALFLELAEELYNFLKSVLVNFGFELPEFAEIKEYLPSFGDDSAEA